MWFCTGFRWSLVWFTRSHFLPKVPKLRNGAPCSYGVSTLYLGNSFHSNRRQFFSDCLIEFHFLETVWIKPKVYYFHCSGLSSRRFIGILFVIFNLMYFKESEVVSVIPLCLATFMRGLDALPVLFVTTAAATFWSYHVLHCSDYLVQIYLYQIKFICASHWLRLKRIFRIATWGRQCLSSRSVSIQIIIRPLPKRRSYVFALLYFHFLPSTQYQ